LHDGRDVGGVRVGPRGHLRQLEVRARHRWESLEAPDDRSNRVAREDRLKITRSGKRGTQDRLVARFGQELLRHGHRPQDGLSVGLARKNQPRSARVVLAHAGQELRTIHFRHPHVRHDDVEGCAPELLQCLLASGHEDHVPSPPLLAKEIPEALQNRLLIVDEQDAGLAHAAMALSGFLPATGSRI
jgi:hypothetical protein